MPPTIALDVIRYRPERDEQPSFHTYEVPFRDDWVVLDALNYIKDRLDGSLSFRWSCRMGVCGSCGMMVNGQPKLSCAAFLSDHQPGPIRVEPLNYFPIVRDLVIDITEFLRKLTKVKPWIIRDQVWPVEEGEYQLRRRLSILTFLDGPDLVADDPWLDLRELSQELRHVDDQIADDGKVVQRFHADGARLMIRQVRRARQLRLAVHHHPAAPADTHPARPAERERPVEPILDVIQRVQHDPVVPKRHFVGLDGGFLVPFGTIPDHVQRDRGRHESLLSPVDALAGRPARDLHGQVVDPRRSVAGSARERVREVLPVIPARMIGALMRSARLPPLKGGSDYRLSQIQHVRELQRRGQLGVER